MGMTVNHIDFTIFQDINRDGKKKNIRSVSTKSLNKKLASVPDTDRLEISDEAKALDAEQEDLSASSGKDILGITKKADDQFIVHFSDSAMVSRAVTRGYIEVNGVHIDLSDKIKKQLLSTDEIAEKDRMNAFEQYWTQYDAAVAKQQSEALSKEAKDLARLMETASKIMSGKKVSRSELTNLMKKAPELYAMAITLARKVRLKCKSDKETDDDQENKDTTPKLEQNGYDTELSVSLDGDTANLNGVSEGMSTFISKA